MWQLDAAHGMGALAAWTGLDGTGTHSLWLYQLRYPAGKREHKHTHTSNTLGTANIHSHIVGVKQRPSISSVIILEFLRCLTNGWLCCYVCEMFTVTVKKSQCPTYTTYKQNKSKHIQIHGKSPNLSPSTLLQKNSHKETCQTQKITLPMCSLILLHPFTRPYTAYCSLISLIFLFWLSLTQTIRLQSNSLQVQMRNYSLYSVVLLRHLCTSSFRHTANTNPLYSLLICPFHWRQTQELSEFHSCNPEIFSLPSHLPLSSTPTPPFSF